MSNGTGPIPEYPRDYNAIKGGICVSSGTYKGCIKVGSDHVWLSRATGSPYHWVTNKGAPGSAMVSMVADIWDMCKEGGTYTYNDELQGWYDGEKEAWRWDGQPGGDISLSQEFTPPG